MQSSQSARPIAKKPGEPGAAPKKAESCGDNPRGDQELTSVITYKKIERSYFFTSDVSDRYRNALKEEVITAITDQRFPRVQQTTVWA